MPRIMFSSLPRVCLSHIQSLLRGIILSQAPAVGPAGWEGPGLGLVENLRLGLPFWRLEPRRMYNMNYRDSAYFTRSEEARGERLCEAELGSCWMGR